MHAVDVFNSLGVMTGQILLGAKNCYLAIENQTYGKFELEPQVTIPNININYYFLE